MRADQGGAPQSNDLADALLAAPLTQAMRQRWFHERLKVLRKGNLAPTVARSTVAEDED